MFGVVWALGYKTYTWDYSGNAFKRELLPIVEKYSECDCICIYDAAWKIWPAYASLIRYSSLTFVDTTGEIKLNAEDYRTKDLIICLTIDVPDEILEEIKNMLPQYQSYEPLYGEWGYSRGYIFHSE